MPLGLDFAGPAVELEGLAVEVGVVSVVADLITPPGAIDVPDAGAQAVDGAPDLALLDPAQGSRLAFVADFVETERFRAVGAFGFSLALAGATGATGASASAVGTTTPSAGARLGLRASFSRCGLLTCGEAVGVVDLSVGGASFLDLMFAGLVQVLAPYFDGIALAGLLGVGGVPGTLIVLGHAVVLLFNAALECRIASQAGARDQAGSTKKHFDGVFHRFDSSRRLLFAVLVS